MKYLKTGVMLLFVTIFVTAMSGMAFAEEVSSEQEEQVSLEEIQTNFPTVTLLENGHVAGYEATVDAEDMTTDELIAMYESPVEEYEVENETGTHYLEIYADGTYSAYGVLDDESEEDTIALASSSSGSEGTSSNRKIYWNQGATAGTYKMYYYVKCGANASKLATVSKTSQTISIVSCTGTLPSLGYTIASGSVVIDTASQSSSSSSAKAHSTAVVSLNGVRNFGMKLTVNVKRNSSTGAFTYSVSTAITG